MYYPEDLVEEVRARNDIVEVISGYVKLQRRGSSHVGLCPFHNEKTPSFYVTPAKQIFHCFGCGAGGNVYTFIMEYENYSFPEAVRMLAERAGVELPKEEYSAEAKRQADIKSAILEMNKKAAKYFYYQLRSEQGTRALQYLKDRDLSDETIKKFGLGFANKYSNDLYAYMKKQDYSDEMLKASGLFQIDERKGIYDKFWNRVIFPIMDANNRVIGFGGRVMGDGKPKYLNSPETKVFDKSRNLYGLNFARTARRPNMLICEGYMDVIALHQAGFTNAVASLGTAFTYQQASLLKRYTEEVLITYDSDGAGVKAALRAIPILKEAGLSVKVLDLTPHKDPDEFIKHEGAEAFEARIEKALNGFLYEIKMLEQGFDLKDPQEKTRFYNEIADKLLGFSEELERENYIEAVASIYSIGFTNLRNLVNKRGIGVKPQAAPKQPKSGINSRRDKEDGMLTSQKLLLTWLIEEEALYEQVKIYIGPEDFTVPLYRKVAGLLFDQLANGQVNPAQIISLFEEQDEQKQIASLFNAALRDLQTTEEKTKALKETILRVKQNSIEYRSANLEPTDMQGLQQVIADKRALQDIQKLHISID